MRGDAPTPAAGRTITCPTRAYSRKIQLGMIALAPYTRSDASAVRSTPYTVTRSPVAPGNGERFGTRVWRFTWRDASSAQLEFLRAELDAYYARLYGLSRDELRYVLDPQEVYGSDFPGETFRVLTKSHLRSRKIAKVITKKMRRNCDAQPLDARPSPVIE